MKMPRRKAGFWEREVVLKGGGAPKLRRLSIQKAMQRDRKVARAWARVGASRGLWDLD